jgi:hypothetical protein
MSHLKARALMTIVVGTLLGAGGCATMTPEERSAFGVYWDAARECEQRYRNLHVDRVQSNGDVSLSAELDLPRNLAEFTQCYHDGIRDAVVRRERSGQPVLQTLNPNPAVELD